MIDKLIKIKVRLLSGSYHRKTRLHDIRGNLVPFSRLIRNGSRAVAGGLLRVLFKLRPERPWISYTVAGEMDRFLSKDSVVLEYGSGMSTVWLAKRCARVYSVDDNREWFNRVSARLRRHSLNNVVLEFRPDPDSYAGFPDDKSPRFDLIYIDGICREECLRTAFPLLKPGGRIFLDDTDKEKKGKPNPSDLYLRELVARKRGELKYYTDFSPTEFAVTQCALARFP